MLLAHLLGHLITIGTLRVIDADGRNHVFSGAPGPEVRIRLHDPALYRKLFSKPRLYAGQAYMDGALTVEGGTIYDFLDLVSWNMERAPRHPFRPFYAGFGKFLRGLQQYNPIHRSRANVAHHYDLSGRLYELFLDRDRQYSCAYFIDPGDDLETAQLNKKRHLAAKLLLEPGQRVLDIGSGWGGLARHLASECVIEGTGPALSAEPHKQGTQHAAAAVRDDRVCFHSEGYLAKTGIDDR